MTNDAFTPALKWFTGKSLENAKAALAMLEESIKHGSWLPRHSVKVPAALNKANVAAKFAKANEEALEAINHYMVNDRYVKEIADLPWTVKGREISHCMRFGSFRNIQKVDFAAIAAAAPAESRHLVATGEEYAKDFAAIAAAIEKLDRTKPVPVFTKLGVSPTVTATLNAMGLDGNLATLRVPEFEEYETEMYNSKTKRMEIVKLQRPVWPAGTVHRKSRYYRSDRHMLCQACGHAIKNPWNWVPLLIDDAAGVPHSMWVGGDCAHSIFGIKKTGDLHIQNLDKELGK